CARDEICAGNPYRTMDESLWDSHCEHLPLYRLHAGYTLRRNALNVRCPCSRCIHDHPGWDKSTLRTYPKHSPRIAFNRYHCIRFDHYPGFFTGGLQRTSEPPIINVPLITYKQCPDDELP